MLFQYNMSQKQYLVAGSACEVVLQLYFRGVDPAHVRPKLSWFRLAAPSEGPLLRDTSNRMSLRLQIHYCV